MPESMNTIMADGPSANPSQPVKQQMRAWGTWVEDTIAAGLSNGSLVYDALANLGADLAPGANSSAWVIGDPLASNNGIYRKAGASGSGSWVRIADLPYSFIKASNAGAGTANAIVATTSIPIPAADGAALIVLPVTVSNSASPVTVAFNGGPALTIKTSAGNDVVAGGLVAGMVIAGYVSASTFRLLSDQASAAIQAAAEAAVSAAAGSAAAAAGSATNAAASETALDALKNGIAGGTAGQSLVKQSVTDFDYEWQFPAGEGPPIVILATGQSNIQARPAYTWEPSPNLQLWPWYGAFHDDDDVASAFITMEQNMSPAYSFANEVAKANPNRPVYVFNIGWGNMDITHWMAGATTPDMWLAITNNVAAGLATIGVDVIDCLYWWQGESDAGTGSTSYPANFETVMGRFAGETWFRNNTPVVIMGLSPVAATLGVRYFDDTFKQIAARSPETRTFVSLAEMKPTSMWEATAYVHLTAEGYEIAGRRAYNAFTSGANSGSNYAASTKIIKRAAQSMASITTLANDTELRCYLRSGRTYIMKARIHAAITGGGDFKWGFYGPTASRNDYKVNCVASGGSPILEGVSGSVWPTNKVVTTTAGVLWLDIDIFVSATADGIVIFQWAQNTSNASPVFIFNGSYLEILEVPYAG